MTTELKRSVSAPLLFLYGLGTMLGAGIYALIGEVTAVAGHAAPYAFLLAALLASLTAMSFAELSSRLPRAAGESAYIGEGFRSRTLALIVGLLIIASGIVSSGVMMRSFHGYLTEFSDFPLLATLIVIGILIGLISLWGVTESLGIIAVITLIELGVLLAIIGLGLMSPPAQTTITLPDSASSLPLMGILSGAVLAFYAYIGFEDMVNLAEEVKHPRIAIPLAIFGTMVVTSILYIGVAAVAVRAVPTAELGQSDAPMALIFTSLAGQGGKVISLVALFAVINGALVQVVMASRIFYGLSAQGMLPGWFGQVSKRTKTPANATLLVTALVIFAAVLFPLDLLGRLTSFFLLTIFSLVNFALIRIKQMGLEHGEKIRVPLPVVWLAGLSSAGFALFSLFTSISAEH